MKLKKGKHIRYIAWATSFTLILTIFSFNILDSKYGSDQKNESNALGTNSFNAEDRNIANDISNMTGVNIDEVVKLRKSGKQWNEVMQLLNYNKDNKSNSNNNLMDRLSDKDMKQEYVDKLKSEGFSNQEIVEGKMICERVLFQLKEITSQTDEQGIVDSSGKLVDSTTQVLPIKDEKNNKVNKNIEMYSKLYEKIDINKGVYYTLHLKSPLGSLQKAFDEYLLSLIIEIDIEKLLKDRKAYEKEKEEKIKTMDPDTLLTIEKIEEKALEKLQNDNVNNHKKTEAYGAVKNSKANDIGSEKQKEVGTVGEIKAPLPGGAAPSNPLKDILKEVNDQKEKSLR